MLSDEEKKAIESVKDMFEDVTIKDIDEQSITIYGIAMLDVIKVLTIVEKQSKEIEELKEENKEIREWKFVIDNPIDLKKLSELDLIKIFGKTYISEHKIKAKIEEVDYKMIAHQDVRLAVKEALNSLLEKE